MKPVFLIALLAISFAALPCGMAADPIPADRITDWTPGVSVGVPGGIPTDRTHLIDVTKTPYNADNTGATDAQPAIMKAIADAKPKDVVFLPAGKYRIDKSIAIAGGKSNLTLRGAGPEETVVLAHNQSHVAISPGDGGDWWYENRLKLGITGSPKRGATVLSVGDTKGLDAQPNGGIGQICQIALKNDRKLPVTGTTNWDYLRRQLSSIVAKTPTTVTISPGLLFDLPADLAPVLRPGGRYAEGVGIEDLTVDGTNSTMSRGLILVGTSVGCWVKNVILQKAERYIFVIDGSLQCEVRHCWLRQAKSAAGSNRGGLQMGLCSFCLVEDNIVADTFSNMEIDSSSGNVIAYNFCDDKSTQGGILGSSINSNHAPHGSFNLYEGNYVPRFQCDGYHGSASHDTAFRNWFHGTSTVTNQFWIAVNLNRFTRCYNIVGNVLGAKGHVWLYENQETGFSYDKHFLYSFGFPGMGNGWSNGKRAQLSQGEPWEDWQKLLSSARGQGPGPNGFQELDLDVKATAILKGNYNFKDRGVPESESLGGAKLPASLYLKAKPAWFGNLAWPAFGPDVDFEKNKIPALVRFEAGSGSMQAR
jgi:hypothetical protein